MWWSPQSPKSLCHSALHQQHLEANWGSALHIWMGPYIMLKDLRCALMVLPYVLRLTFFPFFLTLSWSRGRCKEYLVYVSLSPIGLKLELKVLVTVRNKGLTSRLRRWHVLSVYDLLYASISEERERDINFRPVGRVASGKSVCSHLALKCFLWPLVVGSQVWVYRCVRLSLCVCVCVCVRTSEIEVKRWVGRVWMNLVQLGKKVLPI